MKDILPKIGEKGYTVDVYYQGGRKILKHRTFKTMSQTLDFAKKYLKTDEYYVTMWKWDLTDY